MTDNKPRITVVLPVYNGGDLLKKSVNSVLRQSISDFEFLICDDASTDDSYEWLNTINDSRIKLNKNSQNLGLFPTLNSLIKDAETLLIKLWTQDDIMESQCLEEILKFHDRYPEIAFSWSLIKFIDENDSVFDQTNAECEIETPETHAAISITWGSITANISTVTIPKNMILLYGYFDETLKYSADFAMWCRLSKNNNIGRINKHLVRVRAHPGQLSRQSYMLEYQLKENQDILNEFLNRLPEKKIYIAKFIKNWKIHTLYFSNYLYLRRIREIDLAKKYLNLLKKYDNILFLSIKWFIIKCLRRVGVEKYIYIFCFKKIYPEFISFKK